MNQTSNPYSHMLATFNPQRFFGRHSERESILRGVTSAEPRSFAITGTRTLGKTTLLKYLGNPRGAKVQDDGFLDEFGPGRPGRLEFIYIDFYQVAGIDIVPVLYQRIVTSGVLRDFIPSFSVNSAGTDTKNALQDALKVVRNEQLRLVLCLDHLDTALVSMNPEDELFLRPLTECVSFIIATEKTLYELKEARLISSPFLNLFIPRNVGLLSEAEAKELIEIPARDAADPFTSDEVAFLLEAAGRQPYMLTLACEFFFDLRKQHPEVKEILPKDKEVQRKVALQIATLPAVTELFLLFWNQLNEDEQHILFEIAAGEPIDRESEQWAVGSLSRKALIYQNLREGDYHVFCELFRDYVRRQRRLRRIRGIEEIVNNLAPLDRKLFEYLLARPNQVCTFEELAREVWRDPNVSKRGLEAAIHRLRTRIEDIDGTGWEYIQNVRGEGYQYVPKPM